MGGAQPLAATMNGARFLGVDVDAARIQRRIDSGYCDRIAHSLDEALAMLAGPRARFPWASSATAPTCCRRLVRRGIVPDVVTDQTSAHDPLNGYVPNGMPLADARLLRVRRSARSTCARCVAAMGAHVRGDARPAARRRGHLRLRQQHPHAGEERRCGATPSTFRASCPSTSGRSSARAAARSAGSRSPAIPPISTAPIALAAARCSRATRRWPAGCRWRAQRIQFQGLPARICWLGYGERAEFGLAINALVRTRRTEGADRDRPRSSGHRLGRVAVPRDRRHARRLATPSPIGRCSTRWSIPRPARRGCSIHNGGGVGIGYSQHAGMVVVADGTDESARRLERVLTSDPGIGVIRHADAGYEEAVQFAKERGIQRPA